MFDLSPAVLATTLAVLVAVVGMPHGGLDHYFGRKLLCERFRDRWWIVFLAAYLGVACVVVAGWFLLPAVTVLAFFTISAWHFGDNSCTAHPARVVEGGMVIWIPLLARPTEVAQLLAWVIPGGNAGSVQSGILLAQPIVWAVAVFFVSRLLLEPTADSAGRKIAFALLFAVLPTLASFTLFFCFWHSLRELAELAKLADATKPWHGLRKVITVAAPMAILAVMPVVIGAAVFAGERAVEPVLVQAVFLGLSAVAVPHILLQEIARHRGINPFSSESSS